MILRDSILIAADAAIVWPWVADPSRHAQWNHHVVSVDRRREGPVHFQERFDMVYRLSASERLSHVEVTECEPNEKVAFSHRIVDERNGRRTEQYVVEHYTLTPQRGGVLVKQSVDLSRAGVPWWFNVLARLIRVFGERSGPDLLGTLKRLAEEDAATAPST